MDQLIGRHDRMTVEAFLDAYALKDGRFELVDGIPVPAADTNARQSRVRRNLVANIGVRLGDGQCEVFGGDMGLKVSEFDLRLPAAAIYCDPVDVAPENDTKRYMLYPSIVFEILSPSRNAGDGMTRRIEYQRLSSVGTIVEIDADRRSVTTYVRAADRAWTMTAYPFGSALRLHDPEIVLTSDEVFRQVEALPASEVQTLG